MPQGEARARIQVMKSGRFLWVRVLDGARYTGPGWADGIYLGPDSGGRVRAEWRLPIPASFRVSGTL